MKRFLLLLTVFLFLGIPLLPGLNAEVSTQAEGRVIFVKQDQVYFDIGEKTGLRPGMAIEIFREGTEIKDPETGQTLGSDEEKISDGEVLFVRDRISAAKPLNLSSSTQVQVGDKVIVQLVPIAVAENTSSLYGVEGVNPDYLAQYVLEGVAAIDFTLGDFDGDGIKEVALTDGKDIYLLAYYGADFVPYFNFEGPWNANFLSLSAGNFNENQRDELYVTNKPGNYTQLLVFEAKDDELTFEQILKTRGFSARVITLNREKLLIGQDFGYSRPFYNPLFRLVWKGHELENRKIQLPQVDSLYGLLPVDFTGDGFDDFAALDRDEQIRLYSSNGREIYKTPDKYGGSSLKVVARDRKTAMFKSDFIRKADLNGDLVEELIVAKNDRAIGGSLLSIQSPLNPFTKSRVVALRYLNGTLVPVWETKDMGGYISHLEVADINGDGSKDCLVSIVTGKGKKARTILRAFDLKRPVKDGGDED